MAEQTEDVVLKTGDGWTIILARSDDRVRIVFDDKPDKTVRDRLKAEAWRWAPSVGAWQRKLTQAAVMSATRIMRQVNTERQAASMLRIYYARTGNALESNRLVLLGERDEPYTRADLERTHVYVTHVKMMISEVFGRFQGETLAAPHRRRLADLLAAGQTDHTSFSCGDVVVEPDGTAWECAAIGWRRMEA